MSNLNFDYLRENELVLKPVLVSLLWVRIMKKNCPQISRHCHCGKSTAYLWRNVLQAGGAGHIQRGAELEPRGQRVPGLAEQLHRQEAKPKKFLCCNNLLSKQSNSPRFLCLAVYIIFSFLPQSLCFAFFIYFFLAAHVARGMPFNRSRKQRSENEPKKEIIT